VDFLYLREMKPALEFSRNDAVSLMHQERATSLRAIADHVEKHRYSAEEIIILLREIADEAEAQAIVTDLRDTL